MYYVFLLLIVVSLLCCVLLLHVGAFLLCYVGVCWRLLVMCSIAHQHLFTMHSCCVFLVFVGASHNLGTSLTLVLFITSFLCTLVVHQCFIIMC
jgi:hypothetical protein